MKYKWATVTYEEVEFDVCISTDLKEQFYLDEIQLAHDKAESNVTSMLDSSVTAFLEIRAIEQIKEEIKSDGADFAFEMQRQQRIEEWAA